MLALKDRDGDTILRRAVGSGSRETFEAVLGALDSMFVPECEVRRGFIGVVLVTKYNRRSLS